MRLRFGWSGAFAHIQTHKNCIGYEKRFSFALFQYDDDDGDGILTKNYTEIE